MGFNQGKRGSYTSVLELLDTELEKTILLRLWGVCLPIILSLPLLEETRHVFKL